MNEWKKETSDRKWKIRESVILKSSLRDLRHDDMVESAKFNFIIIMK